MQPEFSRFTAVFLLVLCTAAAWADETPFVITPESRPRGLSLESRERVFEDASAKLTLDQVRMLDSDKFVPVKELGTLNFDSAYWARVGVKSELPSDMQYLVFADWWDYFDIFVVRADGSVTTLHSGLLKQPADANDKFYPLFSIRPGETLTLFVRFKSTGMFHSPAPPVMVLAQAASRHEVVQPYIYFEGIVVGMLVALALYNLIVALSTRDTAYFLYCIYLFAMAISLLGFMSPTASKLNQYFLPDHPWVAMWLKRLADPVSWIMLLLFDRVFLETRRHLPGWDKAFVAIIVVYAVPSC